MQNAKYPHHIVAFGHSDLRLKTFDWTPSERIESFTCFPRLPIEMRTLIFEAYEDEPRAICFTRPNPTGITQYNIDVHCKAPLPVLLETTQESRKAVIKNYRLVMNRSLLYVHLATDVFYFDEFTTYDIYLRHYLTLAGRDKSAVEGMVTAKEVATQLKHVAIDNKFALETGPDFDAYTYWGGLKSVTIHIMALESMMVGQLLNYRDMDMTETWEFVWKGVTDVTPLLILAQDRDMVCLTEKGDCGWIMENVEERRVADLEAAKPNLDADEEMVIVIEDSDTERSDEE